MDTWTQKDIVQISEAYKEKGLGEFGTHRVHQKQLRQRETVSNLLCELVKIDGGVGSGTDSKKTNIIQTYKGYEVVEDDDHPCPEGTWSMKEDKVIQIHKRTISRIVNIYSIVNPLSNLYKTSKKSQL